MAKQKDTSHVQVIGRVIPNPRGKWSVTADYERLDFVMFQGNGYIASQDNSGKTPGSFDSVWTLVVEKGEKGDKGERGEKGSGAPVFTGEFDINRVYNENDIVEYNGSSYVCMFDETTNIKPDGQDTVEVILNRETVQSPRWRLACKGVSYKISPDGEVAFYNMSNVTGVKTYTDNVYVKEYDAKNVVIKETSLQKKLEDMDKKINYIGQILNKYNLD